ncbi:UrcA family protein [Sphingomonas sp. VNH70]|uniref:UrcA family protein n=1 Tax=Sphingomonas silueang TaxID=3156617 RepID=UPI0032B55B83
MTIRFTVLATAALSCLSSVAHAEAREPVSARVSYAGLDLTSAAGRRTLDARIDRAVRRACVSNASGLRALADVARCRAEMRQDAQVRVAQIGKPVVVAAAR